MAFPFEFVKTNGPDDFISPFVNFTANAAIVAVGGISLGVISNLAFKALGFSEIAKIIATAIPITIGVIGAIGVVGGGYLFTALLNCG